jgi:hypothetical protein
MLYDFNDILIQPAPTTSVRSRSQVTPFYDQDKLPLLMRKTIITSVI